MVLKQKAVTYWEKLKKYPKRYTIPGGVAIVFFLLYGVIFFMDKPVAFSYAGATCSRFLTLFPDMQRSVGSGYEAKPAHVWKVGSVALAASSVCFTPTEPPREGEHKVSLAPGGGWIFRKSFALEVKSPPVAQIATLGKPVPLSRPLTLPLSDTDKIFTYHVKVADIQVPCTSKEKAASCEVKDLGLAQGKQYTIELIRHFEGKRVATIIKKDIVTLSATNVSSGTVKADDTVYIKPKTFDFTFDKSITKATTTLTRVEGETRTPVSSTQIISENKLQMAFSEDLARSMTYEVAIDKVEAIDGSGLEVPYKFVFKTSGGPKVTGVSVGRSGVPMGSTAVITFDQPLSEAQDVSKFVAATGGATLSGKKGSQLLVSLVGVPKCGDFSIKITNDLLSNHDVAGNSEWNFGSRMMCHTVGSIGTSSKGRSINAYYFGNGPISVLYTGAIHGNESSARMLMNNWIDDLEANARNIPANKTVVVVPQVNPDGVASGSRVNARNVDLNRNFGTSDWQKDITDVNNRPFPGGGGEGPMSEPETKALAGLASRLRPAVIMSYHSQGSLLAANQAGASNALAGTYSQLSGYRNTTGQSSTTFEYSISGTADDWYAEKLGVASVLIELGSHTNPQFSRNQKAMWAMLNNS
jgi:protein MpaA